MMIREDKYTATSGARNCNNSVGDTAFREVGGPREVFESLQVKHSVTAYQLETATIFRHYYQV